MQDTARILSQLATSADELVDLFQRAVNERNLGELVRLRTRMLDTAREADKIMADAMAKTAAPRSPLRSSRH